jgi:dihydroorotate dehydrogenase electron transfer subunit
VNQVMTKVITATEILPQFHLLWVEAPEVASVAEPGQFVMVRCGDGPDPLLRRPFSIHRVADEQIAIFFNKVSSFNRVGAGTQKLAEYRKDDYLDLIGPLGRGFSIDPGATTLLLISGGIGIASLFFLAEKAIKEGKSVTLLSGAAKASHLYPHEMLPSQACSVQVTEDGSVGKKGRVTESVQQDVVDDPNTQVFACGPNRMYKDMAREGKYARKPVQVSLEVMMGCGVGACYGCTVNTKNGPKRVCLDGPVFDLHDILWEEIADPY